jgi:putative transposase
MASKGKKTPEHEILAALKIAEAGTPVPEVCRKLGIAQATFYRWKTKYGGCDAEELRELRRLRDENTRMKQMIADLSLDKHILQEALKGKL